MGDTYGLRVIIAGGYVWALICSIFGGVAVYLTTPAFFIVAEPMAEAVIALFLLNNMDAACNNYRPRIHRNHMVFPLIGLSAQLGGLVGPIFNGDIATMTSHWEWCFYHYAIGVAIVLVLPRWSVPHITPHRKEEPNVSID